MTKLYIKKNMSVSKDPDDSIAEFDLAEDPQDSRFVSAKGLRYARDEVEL